MIFHLAVLAVLTVLALQTLVNCLRVPRLARTPAPSPAPPRIAVLVPARDEVDRIELCVQAWIAQDYPAYELIVLDDDSSDDTAARGRAAAGRAPHARVVRGKPLRDGWRGKTQACDRLRGLTEAPVLVFADVDVRPAPDTLARVAAALAALEADAISALPTHWSPSRCVRALAALQSWALLTFVPLWWDTLRRRPLFTVLNGQFLAVRARAYDGAGGFAAVRHALGEDTAFGRRLAALGYTVRVVDGAGVLGCVPYTRLRDLWRANVRNLGAAFFGSRVLMLAAAGGLGALYLAPLAGLAFGLAASGSSLTARWLPLAEVVLAIAPRALVDRRAGYSRALALLHPLAMAGLAAMILDADWRLTRGGTVEWRGRRYAVTDEAG